MKYFICMALIFSFSYADACYVPPKEFYWDVKKITKKAENIFIGVPVEYLEPDESFTPRVKFRVVDTLKGKNKEYFIIEGFKAEGEVSDFSQHEEAEFWDEAFAGNVVMPGDCGAYGRFTIGHKYLIFSGKYINHPKAQERIINEEDKWLKKILKLAK